MNEISAVPEIPKTYFTDAWNLFKSAITSIFLNAELTMNIEMLYQLVENICFLQMDKELFDLFSKEVFTRIQENIKELYNATDSNDYLKIFEVFWSKHKEQVMRVRQIFIPLERNYMIKKESSKSIEVLCNQLFDKACNNKPEIIKKLLDSILIEIRNERNNLPSKESQRLLKNSIGVLMNYYKNEFEDCLYEETRDYYIKESEEMISKSGIKEYLLYVNDRIKDEEERANMYLDHTIGGKLQKVLRDTIIKKHAIPLINEGLEVLLKEEAVSEITNLYNIMRSVNEVDALSKAWTSYLLKEGRVIMQSKEKSDVIVEKLLNFKESMEEILKISFESQVTFKLALKSSFEAFLNSDNAAEYLAKYLDHFLSSKTNSINAKSEILRTKSLKNMLNYNTINKDQPQEERKHHKNTKESKKEVISQNKESASEMEDIETGLQNNIKILLEKCMGLFSFILDKDMFEAFYLQRLGKRLLFNKITIPEYEKYLLERLKEECGVSCTMKADAMFQDIQTNEKYSKGFNTYLKKHNIPLPKVKFTPLILTLNSWPTLPSTPICLLKEITSIITIIS